MKETQAKNYDWQCSNLIKLKTLILEKKQKKKKKKKKKDKISSYMIAQQFRYFYAYKLRKFIHCKLHLVYIVTFFV